MLHTGNGEDGEDGEDELVEDEKVAVDVEMKACMYCKSSPGDKEVKVE